MSYPAIIEQLRPLNEKKILTLVDSLDEDELVAVLSDWNLWSLPHQRLPGGKWRRWVARCGRGAGKTHTGARVTTEVARDRKKIKRGEIGIIGRTYSDTRYTMIEGPSGILAVSPPDFTPKWSPGDGVLRWPNGITGRTFSADKPESMRGPNLSWIWGDEPAHWPDAEKTWWEVIEFALRIGWARCILTTTPLPTSFMKKLEKKGDTVTTRASTYDNPYLGKEVRQTYIDHYEGTRIGRQELHGEYLPTNERALWQHPVIDIHRVKKAPKDLRRIAVAIDPAVTAHANSDETGIVVAGIATNDECYILDDKTMRGSPLEWATEAVSLYNRFGADAIVPEVNNGGDLVETVIRSVDKKVNISPVRASRGKITRAEPVAAMYERGKVHHVGVFRELEDQMTEWDPSLNSSPDRIDALVWAIFDLALKDENKAGPLRAYL